MMDDLFEEAVGEADGEKAKEVAKVVFWAEEITKAEKRMKPFLESGLECNELYEGNNATPYNILYSNTEVLQPALYNSSPRPVVTPRYKDEDPLAIAAANLCKRTLDYLLDAAIGTEASFHSVVQGSLKQSLVPGLGSMRFRFNAKLKETEEGEPEELSEESVSTEVVPWDGILFGYATVWGDVPWVAFKHYLTKAGVKEDFPGFEDKISFNAISEGKAEMGAEEGVPDLALVYEIWDKQEKQVYFICTSYKEGPLKEVEDPLALTAFFPCPEPLVFTYKIGKLEPLQLYSFYKNQATELNSITVRISKIVKALRVRGAYDATLEGMEKILSADDNELIPLLNAAAFAANGGSLDKALMLVPIEKLVSVLQQLYLQRQEIKAVIYEINGISDIMRGSTAASETLGAQQIKTKWGALRLTNGQELVANYVRQGLRIFAEIAVTKLSPETLKKMTNVPYPMQKDRDAAKAQLQQMQQQAQQMQQQQQVIQQQAQAQGIPPEQLPPPQQPPEPPKQLIDMANSPSMEELVGLLNQDLQRSYAIDIESNSTVATDSAEDKNSINELLNAMGQFFNSIGPLVDSGKMPFDVAASMLRAIARRYDFGVEVEGMLKQLKEPPKQEDPGAAQAAKAEGMKQQAIMAKLQGDMQAAKMDAQYAEAAHTQKMAELKAQGELAALKSAIALAELREKAKQPARVTPE